MVVSVIIGVITAISRVLSEYQHSLRWYQSSLGLQQASLGGIPFYLGGRRGKGGNNGENGVCDGLIQNITSGMVKRPYTLLEIYFGGYNGRNISPVR